MDSLSTQAKPRDLIGTRLFGDYTIVRKLGEGGMGAVYLARQEAIEQDIAIKVLHGQAAESAEIVERFNREARVISMLTHPNIIRVFIFGRTPGNLMYMAMEFVDGRSLREELNKRPQMDELTAIKIMKQTCSALAEAHDLDIIHRDLKPDNILLTEFRGESNFVKILDFGIAKLTNQAEEKKLTQAGIVYGTPEYLSPEQAQAKALDCRTDIYSLGCILYEMMTGRVPFSSSAAVQVLTMHVFNKPEPPSKVAPGGVAPTMERIILKAMEKDPANRFQSALEMYRALEARERELLAERNVGSSAAYVPGSELTGMFEAVDGSAPPQHVAPSPTPRQPVAPAQPAGPTMHAPEPAASDPTRRVIMILIALAVVVLVVLVTLIVMLATR